MATRLRSFFASQSHRTSILPLAIFRFLFGMIMAISAIRFVTKGWIEELYVIPTYHFKYFGFEWVEVPSQTTLYFMYGALITTAILIAVGLFYRIATIVFFLTFTYVQLMDKALYLNHYYFISLVAFLLILIPAHHNYSFDSLIFKKIKTATVKKIFPNVLKTQIGLVYFFAGIAKLNHDWLIDAMPLKIWLQAKTDFPVLGYFFQFEWTAYAMSWTGALYDLTVPFLLLSTKTRKPAFLILILFHLLTWFLFNIGMFPWIMMLGATIFFSEVEIRQLFPFIPKNNVRAQLEHSFFKAFTPFIFGIFLIAQVIIPLRVHWMNGDSWNEFGYRYSWNVMRVEKTGYVEYRCIDPISKSKWTVYPAGELSTFQLKQMSFQPDMILAYAHHIQTKYDQNIEVYADVWVSINSKLSKRYIDPEQDLMQIEACGFCTFEWVLPEN